MHLSDHHLISPTAMLVSYVRALLNQPYARRIASAIDCEPAATTILGDDPMLMRRICIHLSARYLAVQDCIQESGTTQVLGLGEGLAPNGLVLTEDPAFLYIETDLPGMAIKKRKVLNAIGGSSRLNLLTIPLNALDAEKVRHIATTFLRPQPVTINLEGVFLYLTMAERMLLAENIRQVLAHQGGGCAMVTSVLIRQSYASTVLREALEKAIVALCGITGRDLISIAFEDNDEVVQLFRKCGLSATPVDHVGLFDRLTRLQEYDLPDETVKKILGGLNSFVVKLA